MASCTLPVRLDSSSQNFSLVLSNSDMWRNDTTFVDMIITWERCYFSTIIRLLAIFLFSLIHVRAHTHTHTNVYTHLQSIPSEVWLTCISLQVNFYFLNAFVFHSYFGYHISSAFQIYFFSWLNFPSILFHAVVVILKFCVKEIFRLN